MQKSPKSAPSQSNSFTFILAHNQKQGGLVNRNFMEFIEDQDILSIFEDWKIQKSKRAKEAFAEGHEILKNGDFSDCINFDNL